MKKQKTKICKQCGTENPAEAKFCQSCGSKISTSVVRKVFKLILIVLAVIFILFVGLIVWAFLEVKKEDNQQMNTEYSKNIEQNNTTFHENYEQNTENSSNKPELSEAERAEKEKLLKEKLSKLKLIHDEFSNVDRYYSVNTPTDSQYWYYDRKTFLSPFITHIGDDYELNVISNYYGNGWLFIDDVTVKIDGQFYEPYPEPLKPKFEHEVCHGAYVSEYAIDSVKKLDNTLTSSKYYDILKWMANGNDVAVRFSGKRGSEDLIIDKDRQAIKEVLEAWDIIEELYGK